MSDYCYDCGGEIIFRIGYYGPYPIHVNGGGCRGGSTVARSPQYQRGYGGWTRQEVEQAVKVVRRESAFYSFSGSMRNLAAELGYAVLFPAICRYCGEEIYLFADPNGGFAIFDVVGVPWDKHECIGVRTDTRTYAIRGAHHSPSYRLPVPIDLIAEVPVAEQQLMGVVVKSSESREAESHVFDGRRLWRLAIRPVQPLGTFLRGLVELVRGSNTPLLLRFEILDPSAAESLIIKPPPKATSDEEVAQLVGEPSREPTSDLQLDAGVLRERAPTLAKFLDCAVDARLNGAPFTSFCSLVHLACTKSDVLPPAVKARYVALGLETVAGCRVEPLIAIVASKLAPATVSALDAGQQAELKRLSEVGRLRMQLELRERIMAPITKLLKREERFQLFLDRTYFESKLTVNAIATGLVAEVVTKSKARR